MIAAHAIDGNANRHSGLQKENGLISAATTAQTLNAGIATTGHCAVKGTSSAKAVDALITRRLWS
jgi:hypothetical protein